MFLLEKKRTFYLLVGLLICLVPYSNLTAQNNATISGFIRDEKTGENLIGAAVLVKETQTGTTTNTYGFFSLTLPKATEYHVSIAYLGYQRKEIVVELTQNQTLSVKLTPNTADLSAVEVVGERVEKIQESTQMSMIEIPIKQIKSVPALLGEVDVLKVLQLLPGVQSGNEGASGLYVRGGGSDQNLILLDGTPVYNATHLFGFFSIFNADALNHVELIKGGHPARYGGRLSSVLDISMKEGNMQKFQGEGSIGIVAAKLTMEGPIIKDKASFIVSARRTYIDALARPLIRAQSNGLTAGYYFYDINAKVNYIVSPKDRLYLSFYNGYDEFYAREEYDDSFGGSRSIDRYNSSLGWGNTIGALRWNRVLGPKLFANTHLTYTKYNFEVGFETESILEIPGEPRDRQFIASKYLSNITDVAIKTDFDYVPNSNHYIRFGPFLTRHNFKPGAVTSIYEGDGFDVPELFIGSPERKANEYGAYIEDEYRVNNRLKVSYGFRLVGFNIDNQTYGSVEPRLSARYLLTDEIALKASFSRMTQFIHLLTNSSIGLPTDLWVPATSRIAPQKSNQVAIGAARSLAKKGYEISVETYYKSMKGLIEYKEGASFLDLNTNWEDQVVRGDGEAYGFEFFLQKKEGRFSGWAGYTLSWSNRTFADLNFGKTFPYKYDRRHDISLVAFYKVSDTWSISGTWVYGTGNAITLPLSEYNLPNAGTVKNYSERNGYRMRAYHRLDFGATRTVKTKYGERMFNIGAYNMYSRRNPFFIGLREQFDFQTGRSTRRFVQYSLFPIIPSVSWSFKF